MPCCASEIVINVRMCVASAQDTTSLFTRDMYGRGGDIARALWCEMHAKGEGKPAQRNAPPFITPCSHPFTLQRPRNPPPCPISPRVNGGTANRACAIHPRHTTRFTRTRRQNLNLINKFVQKDAPKGAGSSAAIAAMF